MQKLGIFTALGLVGGFAASAGTLDNGGWINHSPCDTAADRKLYVDVYQCRSPEKNSGLEYPICLAMLAPQKGEKKGQMDVLFGMHGGQTNDSLWDRYSLKYEDCGDTVSAKGGRGFCRALVDGAKGAVQETGDTVGGLYYMAGNLPASDFVGMLSVAPAAVATTPIRALVSGLTDRYRVELKFNRQARKLALRFKANRLDTSKNPVECVAVPMPEPELPPNPTAEELEDHVPEEK